MSYAINPSHIYKLIETPATFIDIREPYQYNDLHIKNFINIPEDYFSYSLNSLPIDKPIYLICYSGRKAQKLVMQLRQLNYDAYYIEGGFQAFLDLSKNQYF